MGHNESKQQSVDGHSSSTKSTTVVQENEQQEQEQGVCLSESSSLLTDERIAYLRSPLPAKHKEHEAWNLQYSSRRDGFSIRTFFNQVANHGANFLVIRDTNGYIFGGFADQSWAKQTPLHGGKDCFVFTLSPEMSMYRSAHDKCLYFNFGFPSHSPNWNGLGMGGRMKYFALSINQDFSTGTSNSSTATFSSPCLASSKDFVISEIEVWGFPLDKKAEEAIKTQRHMQNLIQTRARKVDVSELAADMSILSHAGVHNSNTDYVEQKIEQAAANKKKLEI